MPSKKKPSRENDAGTSSLPESDPESMTSADATTATEHDALPAVIERPAPLPDFPVVGIGASAGGLKAVEGFFSGLSAETQPRMAFVLVQHLAPDHESQLPQLVQRFCRMPVREAENGTAVEADHVYIIAPGREMVLENGHLRLYPPSTPRGHQLPIDCFFRSLAREQGDHAICIVLSGAGSDGTLGVRAVKGDGGMAMVQEPSTTDFGAMPRAAIATGMVDYVLPPSDMAAHLLAYVKHRFGSESAANNKAAHNDSALKRLTALLRAQTGHDFSQYKPATLLRRMERRMALNQIASYDDYFRHARENPAELEGLFRDLLIGVTNFFRDPEAFRVLEEKVIPRLMKSKDSHDGFRVWVCGCSTGEEAYSIAILIQEHLERSKRAMKVQVFATDIDHLAIEQARSGVFPGSIGADVSPERLNRFFVRDVTRDEYRVQKVIRDMLVFSEQDIIRDPPFSKLDLISCRNLLIYLNADVQRRIIPLFHYALNPGGVLFLGTSEAVGEFGRLFSTVDRKWKVFNRENNDAEPARVGLSDFVPVREARTRKRAFPTSPASDPPASWRHLTEQALLEHYADAGVLINARGDILYIHGRTGHYLEPAAGDATLNILSMAREGLRRELATTLHRAVAHQKPAEYRSIRVRANGGFVLADLTVNPVQIPHAANSDLFLVILDEKPIAEETEKRPSTADDPDTSARLAELERELKAKDDYLQTTLEEMETTNEELKSTNEEMQSVNEELQSTNEELETSKEELQSVNEELSTVNAELQDKVADLSRMNNDMNNLLAGTGVATVFVDNSLRILRYTPTATQLINLIPGDIGRPVEHIVSNLAGYDTLMDNLRGVLDTLVPKDAEVQTRSGVWYLMRLRPYRTLDNTIEGVVVTFVDISERKAAEQKLRESEARFHAIFNQAFAGVAQTDLDGRFIFVNDRFCEMLGYSRGELLKMRMLDVTHGDDLARSSVLLDSLATNGPDFSIERRYVRRDQSVVWVSDRVSGIREGSKVTSAVSISFDLSQRKRLEAEAATVDARLTGELDALSRLEAVRSLTLTPTNERAVLDELLHSAVAISHAEFGTLELCDPEADTLTVAAQLGFDGTFIAHRNSELTRRGSCTDSLQELKPLAVEDVTTSPHFVDTPALEALLAAGVRALQSVPLVSRSGRTVGVLTTYFRSPHRADARKGRLFDLVAREAADVIERGRFPEPAHEARGEPADMG